MKLLVQGDDYGFTDAVTCGIFDAARNGVLRNTGAFMNMPGVEDALDRIKAIPGVCVGIDFNIVSGRPVSSPDMIPHLVDETGEFIRSSLRVKNPLWQSLEGRRVLFPYDEVRKELTAQLDRFVKVTGKLPGYLHSHSISPENYEQVICELSDQTGIPYSHEIRDRLNMFNYRSVMDTGSKAKIFNPVEQLNKQPLRSFLQIADQSLSYEYGFLGGHPGYVDASLIHYSTLSLERIRDHAFYTSPELRNWITNHHVQLITYADLI